MKMRQILVRKKRESGKELFSNLKFYPTINKKIGLLGKVVGTMLKSEHKQKMFVIRRLLRFVTLCRKGTLIAYLEALEEGNFEGFE